MVFAATPLFTVFLAPLHRIETFRMRGLVGSLITLVGIVVLANPTGADRLPWLSLLAMLGSAAAAAEAGVVLKLLPSAHPVATNAIAMGIGGPSLADRLAPRRRVVGPAGRDGDLVGGVVSRSGRDPWGSSVCTSSYSAVGRRHRLPMPRP